MKPTIKNQVIEELELEIEKSKEIMKKDKQQKALKWNLWEMKWEQHFYDWEKTCQEIDQLTKKYE